MQTGTATRATLDAARATTPLARCADDALLLAEAESWEAIGRVVDARRVALAAEIQSRSDPRLGAAGLAHREGFASGEDLLQERLRIGYREARRRAALGRPLAPVLSLMADELPARFPSVADGVRSGRIGLDSARVIVDMLERARKRATPEDVVLADAALAELAETVSPEVLTVHAEVWEALIDPDGAEPNAAERHRKRSFTIGATGSDGMTRSVIISGEEETAELRALLAAKRRTVEWVRRIEDGADPESDEPCWHEAQGDGRTTAQYDHDVLMQTLRAGLRAEQEGGGESLVSPWEIVVHTTASDVGERGGRGWVDGERAAVAMSTLERLSCGGAVRLLVEDEAGAPLTLGRSQRLFTRRQRRALAGRDGGCGWPGCTAPLAWTDAHHVEWWNRDDGPTDVDNGVLLCSFHHHLIHSTDRWEIRMHEALPYLVPKGWRGDPLPRHRMQRHRMRAAARGGAPPG